ncbi:S-formylglutathione hydrolase [Maricaulaceae bacterium MS644]
MEMKSESRCFGGRQQVWTHASKATGTDMTFGLYLPPAAEDGPVPVVLYLSGLTCTHANVMDKAGAQRVCAELGLALLAPDTSPRGTDLPGEHDSYDFGSGAGFYVDAVQAPWSRHYRMESYVTDELLKAAASAAPLDLDAVAITGHSMGGHGALTLGLKRPDLFKAISAFAPIASPLNCPWGEKALTAYIGPDRGAWRAYDACALIEDGKRCEAGILVDQGLADGFLEEQLKPELLEAACKAAGQKLTLHRQEGYDHSYFFIASFIEDHLRWLSERL